MGTDFIRAFNCLLDRSVAGAHEFSATRLGYHPYFLCADIAAVLGIGLGAGYSLYFGQIGLWAVLLNLVLILCGYSGWLRLKKRFFNIHTRTYLQDLLFFLLPAYLGGFHLMGQPMDAALELAGLMLPLALGIGRLGCFFGGCCFGLPSRLGVLYKESFLRPVQGPRSYIPGHPAGERVFPIQLVESLVNFALFAILLGRSAAGVEPLFLTLPLYLLGYSLFRFVAEFYRGHRGRPKRGLLSEAQWASAALVVACSIVLVIFT